MSKLKEFIIRIAKKLMPEMWFQLIWSVYVNHSKKYSESRYRQAYFQKGEKNRNRYCILRYSAPGMGILAVARNCLQACEWAEHNGMIPIVDFEFGQFFMNNLAGKENMWDYIFEQKISAQKLYAQGSVFVGEIDKCYFLPSMSEKLFGNKEEKLVKFKNDNWREYYRILNVYSKKWWIFRSEIMKRFDDEYVKLFKPEMRILGVALREEFSMRKEEIARSRLIEHPHGPNIDEMIKLVKEYKEIWGCTHIFVSTMFKDSIDTFAQEFGEVLIYTERKRENFDEYMQIRIESEKYIRNLDDLYLNFKNAEESIPILRSYDKDRTIEYVEEVYGLSKCSCLLSSKNGGALIACILNGGEYEQMKILEDENQSNLY